MPTLTFSLSETDRTQIDDIVKSGGFRSPDEFVSSAVKAALVKAEIKRINALLREGLECKETIVVTPEYWAELHREIDEVAKREVLE